MTIFVFLLLSLIQSVIGIDKVLVLGGTQFMGRLLVSKLIDLKRYDITLLNRGFSPNPFEENRSIKVIKCDRAERNQCIKLLTSQRVLWDYIIDFTGFHPLQIEDIRTALTRNNRITMKQYIFISTDSIYMSVTSPNHLHAIEEMDTEPPTMEYIKMLKQRNAYQYDYGANKRLCEVALQKYHRSISMKKEVNDVNHEGEEEEDEEFHMEELGLAIPYTILRLPDVLGPYDNIGVYAEYMNRRWRNHSIPAYISPHLMRKRLNSPQIDHSTLLFDYMNYSFSIAYAPDVVRAIVQVMTASPKDLVRCSLHIFLFLFTY